MDMPYFIYSESPIVLDTNNVKEKIHQTWGVNSFSISGSYNHYSPAMEWEVDIERTVLRCELQSDLQTIVLDGYPKEVAHFALWLVRVIYPAEIAFEMTHDSAESSISLTTEMTYQDLFAQLLDL